MSQDKKTIIYEAALSLVYDNQDLSRIKVADIAERANIGKSTVYEYFESKEQVIGEALIYMFNRGIASFEFIIEENKTFKETYILLLEGISALMNKNRNLFDFMTMSQKDLDIHNTIKKIMLLQLEEIRQKYFKMIEKLVDRSVEEGIIKEKPSRYDWHIAVMSSMTCIFVHKQLKEEFNNLSEEEVLEKAYKAYVKLLS
ncbi:TetR/AcrR family transcriptional regulator [Alkalicella caledoniensis]|uniref:TetR/AcrR family transcriptional regulator n=1 Tax=Alkalicella caledoniensis TaxID=2731377 RepID=A0A7G9W9D4_ALKCA|nr:TetR/AcrR family transcriptional regulator [Alkalicella caledoniensis]QNO15296.1 TetR/AcrR family transcriptional regulator [Alkalicella caledoniensis]